MMDHFFDAEALTDPCRECGAPYDTKDERHQFGKIVHAREDGSGVDIWPYTLSDYVAEMRAMMRLVP